MGGREQGRESEGEEGMRGRHVGMDDAMII